MRSLLLAVSALALLTAAFQPAEARPTVDSPCGTMEKTGEMLTGLSKYFVGDWYAGVRGSYVRQLGRSEPQAVVTDTAVCRAALDAALAQMRENSTGWIERHEERGFDHAVFRYGPYYAVLLASRLDPSEDGRRRWVPFLVFRASDMKFVSIWGV